MIIFYDTETSGLPLWKEPSEAPGQLHVVQIGALLCEDDGRKLASLDMIVSPVPEQWTISAETAAIHGITNERAMKAGLYEADVLRVFWQLASKASKRIAHNDSFDARILRIAFKRFAPGLAERWEQMPAECTMQQTTPICAIPPTEKIVRAGFTKFKSPQLGEAYQHLFGEPFSGAHSAMADVIACRRVWLELRRRAAVQVAPAAAA